MNLYLLRFGTPIETSFASSARVAIVRHHDATQAATLAAVQLRGAGWLTAAVEVLATAVREDAPAVLHAGHFVTHPVEKG